MDRVMVAAEGGANYRELPVTIWYDIKALISDLFQQPGMQDKEKTMTLATAEFARSMGLSESELVQQALKNFVHEKRREVLQARLEILARYHVNNVAELEKRIAEGQAAEHPGWEDLITVENLDARLEELDAYLRDL